MTLITFNTNDNVRVKLTDHGRAIHRKRHDELVARFGIAYPYSAPKEDADGWSKWQLWVLMQEFGPHISLSGPLMFETTIQIPVKDEVTTSASRIDG